MEEKTNKVVVITGASSGIGRATALELSKEGHSLVLASRTKKVLSDLAEECKSLGAREAIPYSLDVSYENEVSALAKKAVNEFGRIDVWVNNAAVTVLGKLEDIPTADIQRVIDVNVMGYIYGARAAVKRFKEQGYGTLINVSSIVGITGQPYVIPYSISKAAIRGLSFSLNQEVADYKDIHVCCVSPAVIDTPIFQNAANYMGREVKAPTPVIPAKEVADAIRDLMDKPSFEVTVGTMAKQNIFMKVFAPDSFDKQIQKKVYTDHFSDEEAYPTSGNLYKSKPENASVSGGWIEKTKSKGGTIRKTAAIVGAAAVASALGAMFLYENQNKGNKMWGSSNGTSGFKNITKKAKKGLPFLN